MDHPRPHCWDDVVGPVEQLLLDRAHRTHRAPRAGRRPALLMVDCYAKVFGDRPQPLAEALDRWPASCGQAAWDALPALQQLLAGARDAGVPVVHTTGEDRPDARLGGATLRGPAAGEDPLAGYELVPPLAARPGELVARKSRASAFFGTTVSSWLRRLDVDTVVLAGETTSGCVRATAVDAHSHGLEVVVVEEAVFDRSPLSHKVALLDLHLKYASVVHLDEALARLAGAPDRTTHPSMIAQG